MTTARAIAPAWLTTAEVAKHLRVDRGTLRAAMQSTPPGMARPWLDIGTGRRPTYSWESARIDAWWREVHEWLKSRSGANDTASAGGTSTGSGSHGPSAAAAAAFDVRAGELATHPPTLLEQVREAVPSRGWDRTPTGGACTRIAGDTLSVDHDPARGGYLVKLWPTGVMGCIGDLGELPAMLRLMADAPDVSDAVLAACLRALATPCP